MTAQDPGPHLRHALAADADDLHAHLQQHVLHRKISGHAAHERVVDRRIAGIRRRRRGWIERGEEAEVARLVQVDVVGRDPLAVVQLILRLRVVGRLVLARRRVRRRQLVQLLRDRVHLCRGLRRFLRSPLRIAREERRMRLLALELRLLAGRETDAL